MEVKDALTLMISFSLLLVGLLSLIVTIVIALTQNHKK
ncbi:MULTISPECIES: putative holin-like toxin [unclassified Paenibacillus]|nr:MULTISPECIES: putative holin-like toxin [unclassified Paenibacillus]